MIKIIATQGKRREIIDRTHDRADAVYLRSEYELAFGPTWTVATLDNKSQKLVEQIAQLRVEGKTNREICEITGREERIVIHHVSKLVDAGKLERRKAGTKEKFPERNQQIVDLRKAGKTERQIAAELNLNWYTVRALLYKFRKRGKL